MITYLLSAVATWLNATGAAIVNFFAATANVRNFGASGSARSTTGAITSGHATLTVASAIDFAAGQGISVAGAGAAGSLLVTSITAISGTTITLAGNAGTTVSSATVLHDDTDAINAAIAAGLASGGAVRFPPGWYECNGPLNGATNSVLVIGAITGSGPLMPLTLAGDAAPPFSGGDASPSVGGAHLHTAVAGSGSVPAFIATAAYGNASGFNDVSVSLKNLYIHTYDAPTISAVNLKSAAAACLVDVQIDTNVAQDAISNPATETWGLILPSVGNFGLAACTRVLVQGYNIAVAVSEHAYLDDCIFIRCGNALQTISNGAAHLAVGTHLNIYQCPCLIAVTDYLPVYLTISAELDKTGDNKWWQWVSGQDIYDPGNLLNGRVLYEATDSGTGDPDVITYTSGQCANVRIEQLNGGKPTITGAKAGNAALASLISTLAAQGILVDSTSA